MPKVPYKLKKANLLAYDPLNDSENKDKNWILLASYCDKTLLRTKIGFFTASLFNNINGNERLYVPQSEFVDVILNDEYIGNYYLTSTVKEGEDRLSVNEKTTDDGGVGFIAEYDRNYYTGEPKWFMSQIKQYPYTFKFPDTDDNLFDNYMSYFEQYLNHFEEALYEQDSNDDWKTYIDIPSFARWFLIHNILANMDTNYFFSKKNSEDDSKLIMGPVWDIDWSLGIGWYHGAKPRPVDYWVVKDWYFETLLQHTEFVSELKSQWLQLNQMYSDLSGIINEKMDQWAAEIEISRKLNSIRWPVSYVTVGDSTGSYEYELDCTKKFLAEHILWLDNVLSEY